MFVLKIKFHQPDNGWMRVDFGHYKSEISDVPCDSLCNLVIAMRNFLSGSFEETVEWSIEPDYEKWIFSRNNKSTNFRIIDAKGKELVMLTNGIAAVNIITKQLTKLENNWIDDPELYNWSWEFPAKLLDKLRIDLEKN